MRTYVHIVGREEIDDQKARVLLDIEHWGNLTQFWVENDDHEPQGYRLRDPGKPSWRVIVCGNDICIVKGCLRKAYYEQLRLPSVAEVIERGLQADQTETLAEMTSENAMLAEESEERRQEIERLTGIIKELNSRVYHYRLGLQTNIAELDVRNKELETAKQELERLNGQVDRYRLWIQTTIQVLEESDSTESDHALAAELRRRLAGLDQRLGQTPPIAQESEVCRQEIERLEGRIARYRGWVEAMIESLKKSYDPADAKLVEGLYGLLSNDR